MNTKWLPPESISKVVDQELNDFLPIIRQILSNRGIDDGKKASEYMNPSFSIIPDIYDLYDSKSAVKRIERAIEGKEKIYIHGDYDVDGITATAILWEYLFRVRGADVMPYIPSRIDEGYGLSEKSVNSIISSGANLIITVDCGIRDVEIIEKYRDQVDFIVTDHHEPGPKIPNNIPVVHPLHPECQYKFGHISGAAVVWLLVGAIESSRGKDLDWETLGWLDLVALSTVCDVMPLIDLNRVLVRYGLDSAKNTDRVGLRSLINASGIESKDLESYHFGYVLGPRINAAGRIGDPLDALRLFTTKDSKQAVDISTELSELNKDRQRLTEEVMAKVYNSIGDVEATKLIFAYGEGWSEGIIGLVAGKIQDKMNRPVIVVTENGNECRGSARSIPGFNIIKAIESFGDMLTNYGGHEMAAGFSIDRNKIEDFKTRLVDFANSQISNEDLMKKIKTDAVVDVSDLTWELQEQLSVLEPFGYANKKPILWIKNSIVIDVKILGSGGNHVKLTVKGASSGFLEAIYFNADEFTKNLNPGDRIDLLGSLDVNNWNGNQNLQFKIVDIKESVV